MNWQSRLTYWLLAGCFFGSGIAGLSYQVVWTRYLSLFLGHTSYAVVAVLVAFMGGLALGNAWLGAVADRARRPLAFYGWLELGIGIYALIFPTYFEVCRDGFLGAARGVSAGGAMLLGMKFLFSLVTIFLPTVLMGATLPALTRFVTRSLGELRSRVAWLYCINSAGAVAGCLVADFWLLPSIGLEMTVYAGAALNLLAGLVCLFVSKSLEQEGGAGKGGAFAPAVEAHAEEFSPSEVRLALWGIGVSGFVAMLYEVAWTRLLGLALGSSTHAFAVMLTTFITGITLGSGLVVRWRFKSTLTAFGWAELALAATLTVSLFFYEYLPYLFIRAASVLARTPDGYPFYTLVQTGVCFLVMLVPTTCLGMTIPLVSRIATSELSKTGRSIGRVFAVNTLGTVLGAGLTGLALMPLLGLPRTFAFGIALNFAIALKVVGRGAWADRRGFGPALAGGGVLFILLCGFLFGERWVRSFHAELWRMPNPPRTWEAFNRVAKIPQIKYHRDGASGTVVVFGIPEPARDGRPATENLVLKVNGKSDAGTKGDVPTQLLSGHIPMLLRPESQEVLVVGIGSGMTIGAVNQHDSLRHMDVVEISPEVVDGARLFHDFSHKALDDSRVKVWVEDAKTFLQLGTNRYDIIISEPSNPWMAGVANVFSREYYEACRKRLKPGGLMVQWIQLYESNNELFDMVLSTFGTSFPHISLWHGSPSDMILVGSVEPLRPSLAAAVERMKSARVRTDLERIGIKHPAVFFWHEVVDSQVGGHLPPAGSVVHSDYYPTLEYAAQKAFFVQGVVSKHREHDHAMEARSGSLLRRYLEQHPMAASDYEAVSDFFSRPGSGAPKLMRSMIQEWRKKAPGLARPVEQELELYAFGNLAELAALRLDTTGAPAGARPRTEESIKVARYRQRLLMETYRSWRSVFHVPDSEPIARLTEELRVKDSQYRAVYTLHLAELAWDRGDDEQCLRLGSEVFASALATAGAPLFAHDAEAPHAVLRRMIDSSLALKRLDLAKELGHLALSRGFAANAPPGLSPPLDAAVRRAAAVLVESAGLGSANR